AGPFREVHQTQQRVRDAPTGGQNDGFARIGCAPPRISLDDVCNTAEAAGIGDARAAKFMYDPFIHNFTRAAPARPSAPSHDSRVDELRLATARQAGTLIAPPGGSKG